MILENFTKKNVFIRPVVLIVVFLASIYLAVQFLQIAGIRFWTVSLSFLITYSTMKLSDVAIWLSEDLL